MSESGISRRDLVRRSGLAAVAGTSLWGLAGCARREEIVQGGADAGTSSGGVASTGLQTRSQIRIEMPTHMEPQDPNTAIMQNGAEQAAKDFGVKVNFRGPDKFSIPAIQKLFDASIASKPTAIAATLPDPAALGPKIEEAVSKGIPVVLFNAGLDDFERLGALTYVGQTELQAGKDAGQRLSQAGLTNVIVVNHQQGQLTLETRAKGVQEGVGGGNVEVVRGRWHEPDPDQERRRERAPPEPRYAGADHARPGAAEQALAAIKASGKEGKVKLATFDISPAVLNAVENKEMLFAIDQQMFFQTYMSVMSLVTYSDVAAAPGDRRPVRPAVRRQDERRGHHLAQLEGDPLMAATTTPTAPPQTPTRVRNVGDAARPARAAPSSRPSPVACSCSCSSPPPPATTASSSMDGTASYLEVAAQVGIIGVPVALLMISGEFDLSVGSMVGAAGMIIAISTSEFTWPLWAGILLAFAVAAAIGLLQRLHRRQDRPAVVHRHARHAVRAARRDDRPHAAC